MEKTDVLGFDSEEKEMEIQTKISSKERTKDKDPLIKIVFFLTNVFFFVFLVSLFLYYGKDITVIYEHGPELTLGTIMILIRIGIMFSFCYYMFKKWFAQEKRYLKNIPFLVGLFFYFSAIGKILDLLLYIYYYSPHYTDSSFLPLAKFREVLFIITFIPLLYLGLRPFLYNIGLKRQWKDKKVLNLRRDIVLIYAVFFGFLISIAYDIYFFIILTAMMSIATYIFMVSLFRFAYKHNTFPTIRANLVMFGFLFYIFATPSNVVLTLFLAEIMTITQINLISESLNFLAMSIIFLGFVLKPK